MHYEGITDGQTPLLAENLRNRKTTPGVALDAIHPGLPHVADSYSPVVQLPLYGVGRNLD